MAVMQSQLQQLAPHPPFRHPTSRSDNMAMAVARTGRADARGTARRAAGGRQRQVRQHDAKTRNRRVG